MSITPKDFPYIKLFLCEKSRHLIAYFFRGTDLRRGADSVLLPKCTKRTQWPKDSPSYGVPKKKTGLRAQIGATEKVFDQMSSFFTEKNLMDGEQLG